MGDSITISSQDDLPRGESSGTRFWFLPLVICAMLALMIVRATGPSDLMDNEQQRQAAYVMDALQNHHWIMQLDEAGEVSSKPPLFTWLAAGMTWLLGSPEPYAMRLVAFFGTAANILLLFSLTRKILGIRTATFAALAYILSGICAKQIWMARMDSLVPLTVTAGAVALWLALENKCNWIWFWLAAAAGLLNKLPIVFIVLFGLLAFIGTGETSKRLMRQQLRPRRLLIFFFGAILFVLICGGWYWLAQRAEPGVYHKLIIEEFADQTFRENRGRFIGSRMYEPPFYFLMRFLPWSIFSIIAAIRLWFHPSIDPAQKRFERFIFWWLIGGLFCFGLLTHQRGDLIFPLYTPGAILAGMEINRLLRKYSDQLILAMAIVCVLVGLKIFTIKSRHHTEAISQTLAVSKMADEIRGKVGANFPITSVDSPTALNIDLNTMRPLYYGSDRAAGRHDFDRNATYDYAAAANLLQSDAAAFIAVLDEKDIQRRVGSKIKIYDLLEAKLPHQTLHLLSNRPTLAPENKMVLGTGPLKITTDGLTWLHASATDFTLAGKGSVTFENQANKPLTIRVSHGNQSATIHQLAPAEVWGETFFKD